MTVNVRVEGGGIYAISEEELERLSRQGVTGLSQMAIRPSMGVITEPTVNDNSIPPLQTVRSPDFQGGIVRPSSAVAIDEERIRINQAINRNRNPSFMEEFLAIDPGQMFNAGTVTGSTLYPNIPTYHTTTSSPSIFSSPISTTSSYKKPYSLFECLPPGWAEQVYARFFDSVIASGVLTAEVFNNLRNIRFKHILYKELETDVKRRFFPVRLTFTINSQVENFSNKVGSPIFSKFCISESDITDRMTGVHLSLGFENTTETVSTDILYSDMHKFTDRISDKLKDPKKDPLFFKEFITNCNWKVSPFLDVSPLLVACMQGTASLLKDNALLATMPTIGSKINQPDKNPAKPEVQDPTQGQLF